MKKLYVATEARYRVNIAEANENEALYTALPETNNSINNMDELRAILSARYSALEICRHLIESMRDRRSEARLVYLVYEEMHYQAMDYDNPDDIRAWLMWAGQKCQGYTEQAKASLRSQAQAGVAPEDWDRRECDRLIFWASEIRDFVLRNIATVLLDEGVPGIYDPNQTRYARHAGEASYY